MSSKTSSHHSRGLKGEGYMSLVRNNPNDGHIIKGYLPGQVWVDAERLTASVIIMQHTLITDWPPQDIQALRAEHLNAILSLRPDILLIGTGERLIFPEANTYAELINQGIGVEVMNTPAACRTYNALASEHRRVAAALFLN